MSYRYDLVIPQGVGNWATGITKRELFAAMAMQGLLANPDESGSYSVFAMNAIRYADALIAALGEQ